MKQTEYKGLRFGSLSQKASDEALEMGHNGMKLINDFCKATPAERKLMNQEVKVGIAAITSYAKLRQSESSFAGILVQVAKMSKEGKNALKNFVINNLPQIAESGKES